MQPLRLAANPEAGFVHVLDRCRRDVVAHGIGKALELPRTILADPGDGRGDQMHTEEMCHEFGQTLLGQQLVVQQIEHKCADPLAILRRRGNALGKCRPRLRAAGRATAAIGAVLGNEQRPRFRQIEHLPGNMAARHRRGQRLTARSAGFWIMLDRGIGLFNPAKRRARMPLLAAGLLA